MSTKVQVGLDPHTTRNHKRGTRGFLFLIDHSNDRMENRYWSNSGSEFSSTVSLSFLSCFMSVTCNQ